MLNTSYLNSNKTPPKEHPFRAQVDIVLSSNDLVKALIKINNLQIQSLLKKTFLRLGFLCFKLEKKWWHYSVVYYYYNNNNNKFICQAPSHFMHKQINEVIDLTRC